MNATDLCYTPATELSRLIRSKALSPVELMEAVLARIDETHGDLNAVCYMWWDIAPIGGPPADPDHDQLNRAALDVMTDAIALDAIACQESALHGLGHWHGTYPGEVETIVDRFVASHAAARPELLAYARSARTGCVL